MDDNISIQIDASGVTNQGYTAIFVAFIAMSGLLYHNFLKLILMN